MRADITKYTVQSWPMPNCCPHDAGTNNYRANDAGANDTGTNDTGTNDTGTNDAGASGCTCCGFKHDVIRRRCRRFGRCWTVFLLI
jgi:hypothetical protein